MGAAGKGIPAWTPFYMVLVNNDDAIWDRGMLGYAKLGWMGMAVEKGVDCEKLTTDLRQCWLMKLCSIAFSK